MAENELRSGSGFGVLCFPENAKWFQGYLVLENRSSFGILAEELVLDDCVKCPDGGYQQLKMTLIDYENASEAELTVEKTGGDFCRLEAENFSFITEIMKTDEKVMPIIEKYFPSLVQSGASQQELESCIICEGDVTVQDIKFRKK